MAYKSSFLVTVALALANVVTSEVERPRIYYPQRVKRESSNGAVADRATVEAEEKRDFLGDLVSDLVGGLEHPKTKPHVTTVVIHKTRVVPPPAKGTGNSPGETVTPTKKKSTSTKTKKPNSGTDSGILVGPTGIVGSTTKTAESTSKGGLLDPIGSLLNPEPTKSTSDEGDEGKTTTAKPSSETNTGEPTASGDNNNTATATTSDGLGAVTSLLLPPPTTESTANSTISEPTQTSLPATPGTSLPATPGTSLPATPGTSSPPVTTSDLPITSTDIPVVNSTTTGTPTAGTATTSITTATDLPVTNGTDTLQSSTIPSTIVDTSTPANVTTPTAGSSVPTTTIPTASATITSVESVPTTPTAPATPTTPKSETLVPSTTAPGVTSIRPTATATNTNTNAWLPTTMMIEPTAFSWSPPTSSKSAHSAQPLPSNIPKVIYPDDNGSDNKSPPPGTVQIQIGFLYPLNYNFVAKNTDAAAQIFEFLPQALAKAGGISASKLEVSELVPYDTRDKWGYITTIAKLHYPESLIDTLKMNMWAPNSLLYHNDIVIVRNLTSVINPKIDLLGNDNDSGMNINPAVGSNSNGDGLDSNDQGSQSSKQKATTAGIAVGALGLSVMYGAAMFIVARRYKRKRQNHRRSNSISSSQGSSEMQYTGTGSPALMGGALLHNERATYGGVAGGRESQNSDQSGMGHSARTANISAPMATENSLGWN